MTTHGSFVDPVPLISWLRDWKQLNDSHKDFCLMIRQNTQEQRINVELVNMIPGNRQMLHIDHTSEEFLFFEPNTSKCI